MTRRNGSRGDEARHEYTGRMLVLVEEEAIADGLKELENKAGIRAASIDTDDDEGQKASDGNVCLRQLGVIIVEGEPEQHKRIAIAVDDDQSPILAMEPERVVRMIARRRSAQQLAAPGIHGNDAAGLGFDIPSGLIQPGQPDNSNRSDAPQLTREFLRGYREAIAHLETLLFAGGPGAGSQGEIGALVEGATWGLSLTRVTASRYSGAGIKLAVLDTGFDLKHPDFTGRTVVSRSFITGETVQDLQGHGTHCIGTACGPKAPSGSVARYGVAYGAAIYAGKVLDNDGSGTDASILAGINWAVAQGCQIVSMSLGAPVSPGESYSQVYETAARRAVQRGTLIIAAAGNESERPAYIAPVGHPANCPSIIAVGALDQQLRVAEFSCGGLNSSGGEVNIAGPGVGILSSWPMPSRYRSISGTSMATPHVAGIAALFAEATGLRGMELANAILRASRRLTPARDFGWGLVQSM